jgi:hypothetical protein
LEGVEGGGAGAVAEVDGEAGPGDPDFVFGAFEAFGPGGDFGGVGVKIGDVGGDF